MKRLLGIFAHPDDESVSPGGTIAKYAKNGCLVDLVAATRGDKGGDPDVRTKELEDAAGHLGVRSITFLDFKDGKLAGTPPGEIEDALVKVFTQICPDVVIAHEPQGITNHPDHIKMSYAATFAYQVYAKEHDEAKLYYACFPESVISYLVNAKRFPDKMFDRPILGTEDKRITTVIDIKRFAGAKRKALESHITQLPMLEKYLINDQFFRQEYFVLRMVGLNEVFLGKNDRISDRL